MLRIDTIGISLDMGIIPPVSRLKSKISSFGITADFGVIPPKNYFKGKISTVGISGELLPEEERNSILFYQIY